MDTAGGIIYGMLPYAGLLADCLWTVQAGGLFPKRLIED
jgi:hypothetical protein